MKKTLPVLLTVVSTILLGGCSGANKPTPAQCEGTYAAAITTCDLAFAKPDEAAKCKAAATALRLVCLIAAESNDGSKTAAKAGASKADRWVEKYPELVAGQITAEEFEAYVLGK